MTNCSSDQLRCSLIQDPSKNDSINYILSRADGTIPEEVEIGQKDHPYSYPKDQKDFDWKFIDHTSDMRNIVQLRAAQEAFNSVQKITKLKIDYEKDSTKKTDFTIEWLEDIESFNGLTVLAHAWLFQPGSKKNGIIEFNDSLESKWFFTALGWPVEAYLADPFNYNPGQKDASGNLLMLKSQSLVKITMHELGHVLGLRHDLINTESMMYPSISRSYSAGEIIKESFYWDTVTSIPRLTEKYGSSHIFQRWLNRWRDRRTNESTYKRYNNK